MAPSMTDIRIRFGGFRYVGAGRHAWTNAAREQLQAVTSRDDPEMSISGILSCNTTASTEQLNTSSGSQKRVRYAGDVTYLDNISPQGATAVLPNFQKQLHDALKRNRRLKQQNYRLKKKLNKLETITNELKRQDIILTQGAILMKQRNCNELLKKLTRGPSGNRCTAVIRTFATTVFFYSAKQVFFFSFWSQHLVLPVCTKFHLKLNFCELQLIRDEATEYNWATCSKICLNLIRG
ncbi:hypothetical protein quinque_009441 [Culex quinquefasciatus]